MSVDKPVPTERPTGMGTAAFNMALALSKRRVQVFYVCRGKIDQVYPVNDCMRVYSLRSFARSNAITSLKILKSEGSDFSHFHSSSSLPSIVFEKTLGRKLVAHSHGDEPLRPIRLTLMRQIGMNLSDRVIAVSEFTKNELIRNHRIPPSKIAAIHNGVETEVFRPADNDDQTLAKYGLARYENVILSIGALQKRKGQRIMVECLPRILQSYPRLVYVNVGPTYKESFRRDLIARARELSVADNLMLLSNVPTHDLVSLINRAELCVHLSLRESFGLAVVEEMACGKPVLAFKVGAIPEIIEHRKDGWLIEPSDGAGLVSALLLLLQDEALRRRIGAEARKKVVGAFTWGQTAASLEEAYKNLLS